MLSPCLASVTTDESAPVTTDGTVSVPKLVAEVLSVLTVEHSAGRDNNIPVCLCTFLHFSLSEIRKRGENDKETTSPVVLHYSL